LLEIAQFYFISAAICKWKFDQLNFIASNHVALNTSFFNYPTLHKCPKRFYDQCL